MKTILHSVIICIFCSTQAMQPADSELFPESLARVDVVASFPDWDALLSLKQWQKDDVLEKMLIDHNWRPWNEKRKAIAAAIYAGADPNLSDRDAHPLLAACEAQDFYLIQILCNLGAQPAIADSKIWGKRLLAFVRKARIAEYLIERGAQVTSNGVTNLLETAMKGHYSAKLVPLYFKHGACIPYRPSSIEFTIFHALVLHASDYENGSRRLLKKCNALLTHLSDEVILTLLNTNYFPARFFPQNISYKPAEYAYRLDEEGRKDWGRGANPNAVLLADIFNRYQRAIEQKKAHQTDVPLI